MVWCLRQGLVARDEDENAGLRIGGAKVSTGSHGCQGFGVWSVVLKIGGGGGGRDTGAGQCAPGSCAAG